MMYAMYGYIRMAGREDEETLIALFTSYEKAREYEKRARLKNPSWKKKYRSNTMLGNYHQVDIEEYEEPDVPVDPEPENRVEHN